MSISKPHNSYAAQLNDYKPAHHPNNKSVRPFFNGRLKLDSRSFQNHKMFRNLIEPPLAIENENNFALNIKYFHKLANYTIFR